MTPIVFVLSLLIAMAVGAIAVVGIYRGGAIPSLTKRDFGWLGWKPTHQHYKGGFYEEATRATVTDPMEAGETAVVYVHESGSTYARPARMFDEPARFKEIVQ